MTWKDTIKKDVNPQDRTALLHQQINSIKGLKANVALEVLNNAYDNDEGKFILTKQRVKRIGRELKELQSMDKDTMITKLAVIMALGLPMREFYR